MFASSGSCHLKVSWDRTKKYQHLYEHLKSYLNSHFPNPSGISNVFNPYFLSISLTQKWLEFRIRNDGYGHSWAFPLKVSLKNINAGRKSGKFEIFSTIAQTSRFFTSTICLKFCEVDVLISHLTLSYICKICK